MSYDTSTSPDVDEIMEIVSKYAYLVNQTYQEAILMKVSNELDLHLRPSRSGFKSMFITRHARFLDGQWQYKPWPRSYKEVYEQLTHDLGSFDFIALDDSGISTVLLNRNPDGWIALQLEYDAANDHYIYFRDNGRRKEEDRYERFL